MHRDDRERVARRNHANHANHVRYALMTLETIAGVLVFLGILYGFIYAAVWIAETQHFAVTTR
jgi:hypothetical protein